MNTSVLVEHSINSIAFMALDDKQTERETEPLLKGKNLVFAIL